MSIVVPLLVSVSGILTYNDLQLQITRLLDGEDAVASSISTNTIAQVIALGERRIYRNLKSAFNEKAWGLTVTANAVTLPADFQTASIVHFGKKPLEPVSEEFLLERNTFDTSGTPRFFAVAGGSLIFSPAVATGTALQGRYYCSLPALNASTLPGNALFAASEDLFIYAALAESAPFFEQDQRVPMWNAKFNAILDDINTNQQRAAYSAGRIRIRPSTRLMR